MKDKWSDGMPTSWLSVRMEDNLRKVGDQATNGVTVCGREVADLGSDGTLRFACLDFFGGRASKSEAAGGSTRGRAAIDHVL